MKKFFALLLLISSVTYGKINPQLYLYGEKPRLAKPETKFAANLAMAREEYETFIITLPEVKSKDLISKIKLTWKGKTPAVEFKTYELFGHNFKNSSFKSGFKAGEIVDIPVPYEWLLEESMTPPAYSVMSQANYLFEIYTTQKAEAGIYEGELSFSALKETITLPVKLQIYDVTLPAKFTLKTSFGYAPWEVTKKHFGGWDKGERNLNDQYISAALEHRIDLHKIYDKFPEQNAKDPLTEAPANQRSFNAQSKPLYAGLMHKNGYQMSVTDLPVPKEYKKTESDYPMTAADLEKFWKSLNASVLKNNLKDKTFVYYIDEPSDTDLKFLGNELRQIKKWAPDLKFLVTTPWKQNLENAVDIWVINLIFWDRPSEKPPEFYKQLQAKGQELWFYVGCNSHGCTGAEDITNPDLVTDRASVYARVFPWMAVRYGATGILYYDTVYTYSHGGANSPWVDSFDFTGYGEGGLFYPCTPKLGRCSTPKVIPALRLKILRDGLEDAELLKIAQSKGFDMQAVNKVVRNARDFAMNTADYEMVKRQALEFISKSTDAKKK
ncbi:hypothetical protein CIK05_05140 [Bdellovibrio sp. qaytius]|nr:hypothetical protein CIK05_05140 [Bdellovibrio sp. qaytius]